MKYDVLLRISLGVEFIDPFAVCVMPEVFHGLEGVKQELWKETSPHAAKAAKRSQGGTHGRRKVVVVTGQVPNESEKIGHRGWFVRSSSTLFNHPSHHRVKGVMPGGADHLVAVFFH